MSDPYGHDADEVVDAPRRLEDTRRVGTSRGAFPAAGTRSVDRTPVDLRATQRPGPGLTPLDYDPRNPDTLGTGLTRLNYRPTQHLGSTAQGPLDPDMAPHIAQHDPNSCAWLPAWCEDRAVRLGERPAPWVRSLFAARGRRDLIAWCEAVDAAITKQGG